MVRRCAIDVGSASIKAIIADVNPDTGTIVDIIEETARKVDFAEDMARSYDGNLSHEIMEQGARAIQEIRQAAKDNKATDISAVGGTIFESARNGRAYFNTLSQKTGIKCRIISRQQASLISYHAVLQARSQTGQSVLVWDIGGGSQEMTIRDSEGDLTFYIDPMASITFKNEVIRTVQGKNINTTPSPNPMSVTEVGSALKLAESYAQTHTPIALANRIRSMHPHIVGIGGVHYYSIPALLGEQTDSYTREDLRDALTRWTDKTDDAFNDPYAPTRLTNLILVLGYMDVLDIKAVSPMKINLASGLLVTPEYW